MENRPPATQAGEKGNYFWCVEYSGRWQVALRKQATNLSVATYVGKDSNPVQLLSGQSTGEVELGLSA